MKDVSEDIISILFKKLKRIGAKFGLIEITFQVKIDQKKKIQCLKVHYFFEEKHLTAILLDIWIIMSNKVDSLDVVIIGGGLAGLTTAALLARSGKAVTLFEHSSREIGGRARSAEIDGFYFNQGPHALYLTDANDSILKGDRHNLYWRHSCIERLFNKWWQET